MLSKCDYCHDGDRSFAVIDKDNAYRYCSRMHLALGQLELIGEEINRTAKSTTKQIIRTAVTVVRKAAKALEHEWKAAGRPAA